MADVRWPQDDFGEHAGQRARLDGDGAALAVDRGARDPTASGGEVGDHVTGACMHLDPGSQKRRRWGRSETLEDREIPACVDTRGVVADSHLANATSGTPVVRWNAYPRDMTMTAATDDLATLRSTIQGALLDLATVPDDSLERPWDWDGRGEIDLRYGFFHPIEDLEGTAAEIDRLGDTRSRARVIVTPAAVAVWDLLGVLAGLTDGDLDADPGGGEWTIRLALAHTIASQRSYALYTNWWRQQRIAAGTSPLPEPPDDLDGPKPEETYADGSLEEVRARILGALDEAAHRTADIEDGELGLAGRWSGKSVTVAFRQGRWSPHIAEHTIQIDKTLVMLGRQPSEVDRLVRRVAVAWGRIERALWPVPANEGALALTAAAARRTAETAASVKATGRRSPR